MLAIALVAGLALAQTEVVFDVEIDPVNFVLGGGAIQVGVQFDRTRLGVGVATLPEPTFFHGNPDIGLHMSSVILRVDHHFGPERRGSYLGAVCWLNRAEVIDLASGRATIQRYTPIGLVGGARIPVTTVGFFVDPSLGVTYALGPGRIEAGDAAFDVPRVFALPLVHLGWQPG